MFTSCELFHVNPILFALDAQFAMVPKYSELLQRKESSYGRDVMEYADDYRFAVDD